MRSALAYDAYGYRTIGPHGLERKLEDGRCIVMVDHSTDMEAIRAAMEALDSVPDGGRVDHG